MMRSRSLSVIGVPTSAGAYGPGPGRAPGVFREHGLIEALRNTGIDVRDRGDGTAMPWVADNDHPTARNAAAVVAAAKELAGSVAAALSEDHDVLVVGGDCTIELGTVAGSVADGATVCVAYVDLDTDLNTPDTGDGYLSWMGVAHLLDVPGSIDALSGFGRRRPLLAAPDIRIFAAEHITAAERAVVDSAGLHIEPLMEVVNDRAAVLERTRAWAAGYDRLLVHLDVDVLDYTKFPIAEEVRATPGLELAQLARLIHDLCSLDNLRALTVTQVDPDHAFDQADTFRRLIEVLVKALTKGAQRGNGRDVKRHGGITW
jgi:arginase